jgi:hypothetical protein
MKSESAPGPDTSLFQLSLAAPRHSDPDSLPFSDEMIDEWKKTNLAIIDAWFALDEVATPATSGCGDSLQVREQSFLMEEKIAEEVVAADSGYYSIG